MSSCTVCEHSLRLRRKLNYSYLQNVIFREHCKPTTPCTSLKYLKWRFLINLIHIIIQQKLQL